MSQAPTQRRFASSHGEIGWFEWGTALPGRPTWLMLHATGFHARLWDQVIAHLPPDRHVIAPDLPGHGRSYRAPDIGDWGANAAPIGELLAALALPALIGVGHSMGATALVRLAAASPGTFGRLVLVDPVIFPPAVYPASPPVRDNPADHPIARRRARWASAAAMADHFAGRMPYAAWQRAVLDDYCHWGLVAAADGDGLDLACAPLVEASAYLGATRYDPHPDIAAIAAPTIVLRGRSGTRAGPIDFSISPTWPGLAAAFAAGADQHWADVSHFIPMEQPQRLAALLASA